MRGAPSIEPRVLSARGRESVTRSWIVLGLVGWTLGLVFVLLLMRMSGNQDRAARYEQKRMDPFSEVTITNLGNG